MFFVVSGFLVGGLLISEQKKYGRIDLLRFYARRALKIWPLLYLVPLVYAATAPVLYEKSSLDALLQSVPTFFHVQNYFPLPLGHLWSLAVEEHFYLALPLMITVLALKADSLARRLALIVVVAIVFIFSIRCVAAANGVAPTEIRLLTHYRLDGLLLGVLLAACYHFSQPIWIAVTRGTTTLAVIAIVAAWPFAFNANTSSLLAGPGFTSLAVFYAMILMIFSKLADNRLHPVLEPIARLAAWIGRHSYPIYLFHPFVWAAFLKIGITDAAADAEFWSQSAIWLFGYIAFVVASILIGVLIGSTLEEPLLRLRDRLLPSRSIAL